MKLSDKALATIAAFGIEQCIEDFNSNEWEGNGSSGIVGNGDVMEIRATNRRIDAGREVHKAIKCPY